MSTIAAATTGRTAGPRRPWEQSTLSAPPHAYVVGRMGWCPIVSLAIGTWLWFLKCPRLPLLRSRASL